MQQEQKTAKKRKYFANSYGDNPKLGTKRLADGRESIYLEYYEGNYKEGGKIKTKQHREFLGYYIYSDPRTPMERQQNKDTIEIAKRIRFERSQEMQTRGAYSVVKLKNTDFLAYYRKYIDGYTKKDIRVIKLALDRFTDFLNATPEYREFVNGIKPAQITKDMIADFADYLQTRSSGTGAKTLYARFKKVVLYAVEHGVFTQNPCRGISVNADENIVTKDILSKEEIIKLMGTHYEGEKPVIQRAFKFSLCTGLRFCDVKALTYGNIDFSNRLLRFEQNKTKGHSAASGVVINLRDDVMKLIEPIGGKDDLIFHLPSHAYCVRILKEWVQRAGIDKHITWHCARHTFGTYLLNEGNANPKTVQSLLGHSSLRYTEKYIRAIDKLKKEAVYTLPEVL